MSTHPTIAPPATYSSRLHYHYKNELNRFEKKKLIKQMMRDFKISDKRVYEILKCPPHELMKIPADRLMYLSRSTGLTLDEMCTPYTND